VRCSMTSLGSYWVIATGRHGWAEKVTNLIASRADTDRKLYWLETLMEDVSSTKIREAIAKKEPIGDLTYQNVVDYLKKYCFTK